MNMFLFCYLHRINPIFVLRSGKKEAKWLRLPNECPCACVYGYVLHAFRATKMWFVVFRFVPWSPNTILTETISPWRRKSHFLFQYNITMGDR